MLTCENKMVFQSQHLNSWQWCSVNSSATGDNFTTPTNPNHLGLANIKINIGCVKHPNYLLSTNRATTVFQLSEVFPKLKCLADVYVALCPCLVSFFTFLLLSPSPLWLFLIFLTMCGVCARFMNAIRSASSCPVPTTNTTPVWIGWNSVMWLGPNYFVCFPFKEPRLLPNNFFSSPHTQQAAPWEDFYRIW